MTDHVTTHQAHDDIRNQSIHIYVDGKIVPRKHAVVSVYDSGFMLGDGVWEGVRLYNGKWAFLDEHMDRLFEAAKAIDLDIGMDRKGVISALLNTQKYNEMFDNAHARIMITRGVKILPFQHPSLSQSGPTFVIIMEHSQPKIPRPITLATVPHLRGLPMTQDPKLNSHSKLNCILACIAAQKAGADEALMLDLHGFVNTTNACNFFIVRKGAVWTSTGDYCMNGITRQKVIDLCRVNNITVFERNFSLVDTYGAEEAFLTGTFGAQTPVSMIDGHKAETDASHGGDHAGHDHSGADAHAWLDPANGRVWLGAIAAELSRLDPENAATYVANAAEGQAGLTALEAELTAQLAPLAETGFVVFHDAYQYFEHRFGLAAAGAISFSDATAPSAGRIAELRAAVAGMGAACVFAEPQFSSGLVETVFGDSVTIGLLDPLGQDIAPGPGLYPQVLRGMAGAFSTCLGS